MRVSNAQYAEALSELTGREPKMIAENFHAYLRRRGEEARLPEILEALIRREESRTRKVILEAVTAHPLDEKGRKEIKEKAAELFPGQEVELAYTVDPRVIGGFRLRGKEAEYDATVASTLRELRAALVSSSNR